MSKYLQCLTFNVKSVMWSETVGLDQKSVLVLILHVWSWAAPRILRCTPHFSKTGFASGASENIFLYIPPLFKMWGYKQANISRGLLNILKFAVWLSH